MDYQGCSHPHPILYPLAEGVGGCFSENVIAAVDICIQEALARCPIETTFYPSATELRFPAFFSVGRDGIAIEKAGLARVAFLLQDHLDADELGFVAEHLHEPCMRQLD